MNQDDYCLEVKAVLDGHQDSIRIRLSECLSKLPKDTKTIVIGSHVDQDGEGFLDIRVHLEGPDPYVLNKSLGNSAELFSTVMSENGFDPPLPYMQAGSDAFSVPDILSDCAVEWLANNWNLLAPEKISVPVVAESMDGYGNGQRVALNNPHAV